MIYYGKREKNNQIFGAGGLLSKKHKEKIQNRRVRRGHKQGKEKQHQKEKVTEIALKTGAIFYFEEKEAVQHGKR